MDRRKLAIIGDGADAFGCGLRPVAVAAAIPALRILHARARGQAGEARPPEYPGKPARQPALASHAPFLIAAAARAKLETSGVRRATLAAIASPNLERWLG